MSRKTSSQDVELSTAIVDKNHPRFDARMLSNGAERLSNISRTTAVYTPTMGERIRRYQKTPTLQQDLYRNPDLWDQESDDFQFDPDTGLVISHSPHEERFQEGLRVAKVKKAERDSAEKEALRKKKADENAAFAARVRDAIREGETTTPPQTPPSTT